MELYKTDEKSFDLWIDSRPSAQELLDALIILNRKRLALWEPGHHDSYYRDRFERDEKYARRMVRVKQQLAEAWVASGEVTI